MVQYSSSQFDAAFAALSDPTRRGILEHLGRTDASITDLADRFDITLTGIKKHVQILERSGLVSTEKVGRVRTCTLGPKRLEHEAAWIANHRQTLEERFDSLGKFLERTKEEDDHEHHDRKTARPQSHRHHARRSRHSH
jgi:DNA-binding transcriptional ArsR family regulator